MNETRWLRWGVAAIVVLSLTALAGTLWSLSVVAEERTAAQQRAEQTLAELERLEGRLARQALGLERLESRLTDQAETMAMLTDRLAAQAETLEAQAEASARARVRFEAALQLLLDEAQITDRPFATSSREQDAKLQPDAEPELDEEPEPDAPGKSGDNRRDDNANRPATDRTLLPPLTGLLP